MYSIICSSYSTLVSFAIHMVFQIWMGVGFIIIQVQILHRWWITKGLYSANQTSHTCTCIGTTADSSCILSKCRSLIKRLRSLKPDQYLSVCYHCCCPISDVFLILCSFLKSAWMACNKTSVAHKVSLHFCWCSLIVYSDTLISIIKCHIWIIQVLNLLTLTHIHRDIIALILSITVNFCSSLNIVMS